MRRHRIDDNGEVDPSGVVAAEHRQPPATRPWVLVHMITSLDGATSVGGRSGGLGGPGDRALFRAVRAIADVILVGAGTVRAEGYGPPRLPDETIAARTARDQAPVPRLAVVSAQLDLEPGAPVFAGAGHRPLVATHAGAPADRRTALGAVADVVSFGERSVDLASLLARLRAEGAGIVVCEGGPTLNASLFAADLVDELCLTIAPVVVGGESTRLVAGAPTEVRRFSLDRVLEEDGYLFVRYLRRADPGDR